MDKDDNKLFEYAKTTKLTDDFRRLEKTPTEQTSSIQGSNCVVCLDEFDEPRTLPCQHKFCRVCLQYAIDNSPLDSDSDRGFECILCGHFVKVLNYSIPRSVWADNVPDTKLLHSGHHKKKTSDEIVEDPTRNARKNDKVDDEAYRWHLDWKVSTYSKSYFLENGIDPCERTEHGFKLRNARTLTDKIESKHYGEDIGNKEAESDVNNVKAADKVDIHVNRGGGEVKEGNSYRKSRITSVIYFDGNIVVYDEGLCEVLLYNNDLTLRSSTRQANIFAIAVLDSDLFMTNPEERCIQVLDLDNFRRKESINLTLKCFGISSLGDQLAVLLRDSIDQDFHISFLNSNGIIGGTILLKSSDGNINFTFPRHLTVCPLTRLAYVSDAEIGAVKCFRLDGHLNWERLAYGAGYLSVYNGYVIVARKFTSSLDVLSGGGAFVGRLESSVYGIEEPSVIAVREGETEIVVVDIKNMLHVFNIRKELEAIKVADVSTSSCSSCVLV